MMLLRLCVSILIPFALAASAQEKRLGTTADYEKFIAPLLSDCLSDERLTTALFGGNATTKEVRVPVGYVCLDLLMHVTESKIVFEAECANDGLGACVNTGYYFTCPAPSHVANAPRVRG